MNPWILVKLGIHGMHSVYIKTAHAGRSSRIVQVASRSLKRSAVEQVLLKSETKKQTERLAEVVTLPIRSYSKHQIKVSEFLQLST